MFQREVSHTEGPDVVSQRDPDDFLTVALQRKAWLPGIGDTIKMSSVKFGFTMKSFLDMKGMLESMERKQLSMENQLLTLEFDGEVLKVRVRYNNGTTPKSKVIYKLKSYEPDHVSDSEDSESQSESESDSEDARSHSSWKVECDFRSFQEFFSDEITKNILEELSHEDKDEDEDEDEDKDEKDPSKIGSVYLRYSESLEESQCLLSTRERKGSLVITISNRKPSSTSIACKHCCKKDKKKYTMIRHMVRISVNVLSVKVKDLSVTPSLVTPRCRRRLEF